MLTVGRLRELLHYDPETGVFTRRVDIRGGGRNGTVAGSNHNAGYLSITIDGRQYLAHRLAWFYVTGRWPVVDIDHIDRDRRNNRWANLREATRSQNMANTGRRRDNKSGFKGVSRHVQTGRWQAHSSGGGRTVYLGLFDSAEEAHRAYVAFATDSFGEFARSA